MTKGKIPSQKASGITQAANAAESRSTMAAIVAKETSDVWAESPANYEGCHLTKPQLEYALDRLAAGDTMAQVCDDLQISRATLWLRGRRNSDFARLLLEARAIGAHAMRDHARKVVMGEEGFSTGSIERDKLVWDYYKTLMKADNRDAYGDKPTISANSIIVQLPDSHDFD